MAIYEFIAGAPWINLLLALWGGAIVAVVLYYAWQLRRDRACACFDEIDLLIFAAGMTQKVAFRWGAWVGVSSIEGTATSRLAVAALWLALTIIIVRHARRVK
jgi:hypothetical protein